MKKALTPRLVEIMLDWAGTGSIARLALSSAYLLGGLVKLADFPSAMAEQAYFGIP